MSLAAAVLFATLLDAGGASPAPAYRLVWNRAPGAETCVDAGALADQVGARLGRAVFGEGPAAAVVIDATVRPAGDGWHVSIDVRGPDGSERGARELDQRGPDCRALDEPLALVLALMIDLDVAVEARPPPIAPRRRPGWRAEVSVAATGGLGVRPGLGAGARVAVTVDAPRLWPVVIGATWWAAGERDGSDGTGVRLQPSQVAAAICTPGRGLAVCCGAAVEWIAAAGFGFDANHDVSATVIGAAVSARAAFALPGGVFASVDVGAQVPFTRPRFVFADGGPVLLYQVAPVAAVGAVGVGVRF